MSLVTATTNYGSAEQSSTQTINPPLYPLPKELSNRILNYFFQPSAVTGYDFKQAGNYYASLGNIALTCQTWYNTVQKIVTGDDGAITAIAKLIDENDAITPEKKKEENWKLFNYNFKELIQNGKSQNSYEIECRNNAIDRIKEYRKEILCENVLCFLIASFIITATLTGIIAACLFGGPILSAVTVFLGIPLIIFTGVAFKNHITSNYL